MIGTRPRSALLGFEFHIAVAMATTELVAFMTLHILIELGL